MYTSRLHHQQPSHKPTWLRECYNSLDFLDYQGHRGDDDFEYTCQMCRDLGDFYRSAAKLRRTVIFTVDQ